VGPGAEGQGGLRLVVADTGPALHLHETHALQLLEQTGEVVVPPAVERELGLRISSWANGLPPWLVVTELTNAPQQEARGWTGSDLLDLGEAEALGLARQLGADWFLTDDTAARVIATHSRGRSNQGGPRVGRGGVSGRLTVDDAAELIHGGELDSPARTVETVEAARPGPRPGSRFAISTAPTHPSRSLDDDGFGLIHHVRGHYCSLAQAAEDFLESLL
jgi:hypothetical protein